VIANILVFEILAIGTPGRNWIIFLVCVAALFLLMVTRAVKARGMPHAAAGPNPLMAAVLTPIGKFGPSVSASVYQLPGTVKGEDIAILLAQEPRLQPLLASNQAILNEARTEKGEALFALGGLMDPDIFEKSHQRLRSLNGVKFIVGVGPGCGGLPRRA
jgi:hypothetical protein